MVAAFSMAARGLEEEHMSAKEKRRKWWADRQNRKKQKMDEASDRNKASSSKPTEPTSPPLRSKMPKHAARPSTSTSSQPKQKAMPKPRPTTARPPRGSAGRDPAYPPWRPQIISSDDESFHDFSDSGGLDMMRS